VRQFLEAPATWGNTKADLALRFMHQDSTSRTLEMATQCAGCSLSNLVVSVGAIEPLRSIWDENLLIGDHDECHD